MNVLATCVATVFAALAVLHLWWARGLSIGASAVPEVDGRPLFRPGPVGCIAVAALLAWSGWIVLERAGLLGPHMPGWMVRAGAWVIALVLLARAIGEFRYVGFFKRVTGTAFATNDTRYYSPLALLLGVASAVIAAR